MQEHIDLREQAEGFLCRKGQHRVICGTQTKGL
jgi:hypothetical protein